MNILATLTPAETSFILDGQNARVRELMKVTLMDLLLKKVLKVTSVASQAPKDNTEKTPLYFGRGDAFFTYSAKPHEEIYLSHFRKPNTSPVLYKHLLKLTLPHVNQKWKYQNLVLRSVTLHQCFSQSMMQLLFGGYRRTRQGDALHRNVCSEMNLVQQQLPDLLHSNPAQAMEIIRVIGGNVFLVPGFEVDLMRRIEQAMAEADSIPAPEPVGGWGDVLTTSTYSDFDTTYHNTVGSAHPDSGGGSDGGSSGCGGDGGGHSGCGGDSGCGGGSGCSSGCGGGGCGGGGD